MANPDAPLEKVSRLPEPINSSSDDLDIFLNKAGTVGYFASDRPGGKGKDDIYRLDAPDGLRGLFPSKAFDAIVKVVNLETGEFIEGAKVNVVEVPEGLRHYSMNEVFRTNLMKNEQGENIIRYSVRDQIFKVEGVSVSDQKGQAKVQLMEHKKYLVLAHLAGFKNEHLVYDTYTAPAQSPSIEIGMWPSPKVIPVAPPNLSLGSIIVLDQIYYDFDKSYIRTDASRGLQAIVDLMSKYPEMEIELTSHTDSRGTKEYNKTLSDKRAESAKFFLTCRGISSDRIKALGKGEVSPRNRCQDGVRCSEEEYQYNRRTEIRIIKLKEPNQKIEYLDNPPAYIDRAKGKRN